MSTGGQLQPGEDVDGAGILIGHPADVARHVGTAGLEPLAQPRTHCWSVRVPHRVLEHEDNGLGHRDLLPGLT
jgi:hypothetical protein